MQYIRDVLYIKTLERSIGRRLTEEELENPEGFEVKFLNGITEFIEIPRLPFPDYFINEFSDINYYRHAPYDDHDLKDSASDNAGFYHKKFSNVK